VKRSLCTLFLGILLIQVSGCYVYFITRLTAIRIEMREQLNHLPDDQLTLLTLTTEEYHKAKVDDHEVKVNGKMYDIARVIFHKDNVLVYAIHDEAEDDLLSFLDEIVKRSANDKKPLPSQLVQLLTLIFLPTENQLPVNSSVAFIHATKYTQSYLAFARLIDSPPPRS
jgi:hypothetical protein